MGKVYCFIHLLYNHQWDSTSKELFYVGSKGEFKKMVITSVDLAIEVLHQYHSNPMSGHSGPDFVQILNMGGTHWITVSNVGCDKDSVNIYDSPYKDASPTHKDKLLKQLATATLPSIECSVCSGWFHSGCKRVPHVVLSDISFFCKNCQ